MVLELPSGHAKVGFNFGYSSNALEFDFAEVNLLIAGVLECGECGMVMRAPVLGTKQKNAVLNKWLDGHACTKCARMGTRAHISCSAVLLQRANAERPYHIFEQKIGHNHAFPPQAKPTPDELVNCTASFGLTSSCLLRSANFGK